MRARRARPTNAERHSSPSHGTDGLVDGAFVLGRTAVIAMAQLLAAVLATPPTGRVWHFTDIHVDPLYVMNSSIHDNCNGAVTNDTSAGLFGNATGNCATPWKLYRSALDFMTVENPPVDFVLFTGDYTQAGLHWRI